MNLTDVFTEEEAGQIRTVYSPRNGNIVLGTAAAGPDLFEMLGLREEERYFWMKEWRYEIPEHSQAIAFLRHEIEGRKVIELGPGNCYRILKNAHYFQELGAREYVAVEPMMLEKLENDDWFDTAEQVNKHFSEGSKIALVPNSEPQIRSHVKIPVTAVSSDGLSYLLSQPDNSAIVYSSRVFRPDALFDVGLPNDIAVRYVNNLIHQIGRVTPSGAISLHAGNLFLGTGVGQFNEAGFDTELWMLDHQLPPAGKVPDTERLIYELKNVLGFGGLLLRKREMR